MKFEKKSIFAQRLIKARRFKGMRQFDLAEKLCCMEHSVCSWETDKGFPRVETLISIADLFDVSIDWLLGRTDEGGVK